MMTPSPSLWEWGKTFSLFPQRVRESEPRHGVPKYSHKKTQIYPILKKLDNTIYPYLLRGVTIATSNTAWASDISAP